MARKERVAGRLMTGSNCWMGVMPVGMGSPADVAVVVSDDVIIREVVASWKKLLTSFWFMERDDGRSRESRLSEDGGYGVVRFRNGQPLRRVEGIRPTVEGLKAVRVRVVGIMIVELDC